MRLSELHLNKSGTSGMITVWSASLFMSTDKIQTLIWDTAAFH